MKEYGRQWFGDLCWSILVWLCLLSLVVFQGCAKNGGEPVGFNSTSSQPIVTSPTAPVSGTGAISGTILASGICTSGNVTLTVYSANQPIFQTTAYPNGTYEFQLNPNTYNLVAQASSGCTGQATIQIQANQTQRINIPLAPSSTTTSNPYSANQPTYYGTTTPCVWGSWGCQGSYYPGGGDVFLGKPNIYLRGKLGQNFDIKLSYRNKNNILAAVPVHGPGGWKGSILSSGQLVVNKTVYPYLFYDFRSSTEHLASSGGFCEDRTDVLGKMGAILYEQGFSRRAIGDFQSYWNPRMPRWKRHCVHVFETQGIDLAVSLDITPKPDLVKRVWFIVVPEDQMASLKIKNKIFKKKPVRYARKNSIGRTVASVNSDPELGDNKLEVYEWGVGFLSN
ncbi:MAG: hypothetical protein AB7F43_07595 [Bacteriovoracia bacterium]